MSGRPGGGHPGATGADNARGTTLADVAPHVAHARADVTIERAVIRDTLSPAAVEGRAMIGLPPRRLPYRVRDDRGVGIVAHLPPGKPARDVVCH